MNEAKARVASQCQGGEEISINWKDRQVLVEGEVVFRQARNSPDGDFAEGFGP